VYRVEIQAEPGNVGPAVAGLRPYIAGFDNLSIAETTPGAGDVRSPWAAAERRAERSGDYFIVVQGAAGPFRLRIFPANCPADLNDDNLTSFQDLLDYIADWLSGRGEYDGLGAAEGTLEDFFAYLDDWFAGCR
jgi:hypothetical protein